MSLSSRLRTNMVKLYEIPVHFWQRILGPDLHFHLGHFPTPDTALADSMRIAIRSLAMQLRRSSVRRVLDVGCGWGGPAFELARTWKADIFGLTISKEQSRFINQQSHRRKLPVKAVPIDIENYDFRDIGPFDVLWLYEVLEHIAERDAVLQHLHRAARRDANLAIAISCRSASVPRAELYNEFLGIQPLETISELFSILNNTGWKVVATRDCTVLTLPVWKLWAENTKQVTDERYRDQADRLASEFGRIEELYRSAILTSLQIVATAAR